MLYCIGGGYTGQSPETYRTHTTRLAAATGLPLFVFDYHKAPEHPWPAAIDDGYRALQWVTTHGPDGEAAAADEVILAGDSAGGGIAIAVLLRMHRRGEPPPCALRLVTISAYTDLGCSTPSYVTRVWDEQARTGDPMWSSGDVATDRADGVAWSRKYTFDGEKDNCRHPEVSPYYADDAALGALPPALMLVGDAEVMLDETVLLVARARAAGARIDCVVYPHAWHVWPMYSEACRMEPPAVVVESEDAIDRIAAWCAA